MTAATPTEARIQAAFAAYREAIEGFVRRKPGTVPHLTAKLRDKAANGNAAATLELAIIEGVTPHA